MIKRILVILFSLLLTSTLQAFDGDMYIVAADAVMVRSSGSAKGNAIDVVQAGTIVRMLKRSEKRDKFLPGDAFGFYWYNVELPNKKQGWIYGKFLYGVVGYNFVSDEGIFAQEYVIAGKKYLFGIAKEEAAPVYDEKQGLSGSVIHGLPFFAEIKPNKNPEDVTVKPQAMLFKSLQVRTLQDSELKFPYYFKVSESSDGEQKLTKLEIQNVKGRVSVILTFDYSTQAGGGVFTISSQIENGHLVIKEYKQKESTN